MYTYSLRVEKESHFRLRLLSTGCYLAQAVSLDDVLLPPLFIFGNGPTADWSRYHCVRQVPSSAQGGLVPPQDASGLGHEAGVSVIWPNKLFKPLLGGLIQS